MLPPRFWWGDDVGAVAFKADGCHDLVADLELIGFRRFLHVNGSFRFFTSACYMLLAVGMCGVIKPFPTAHIVC